MRKRHSLRKRNCKRICEAFGDPHLWIMWVDPLSHQNWWEYPRAVKLGYHTFHYKGTPVHVPMEWYWRTIKDWELESLVTAWKLTHDA
jgi:hypothetical protein